jgi:hypothetical protein
MVLVCRWNTVFTISILESDRIGIGWAFSYSQKLVAMTIPTTFFFCGFAYHAFTSKTVFTLFMLASYLYHVHRWFSTVFADSFSWITANSAFRPIAKFTALMVAAHYQDPSLLTTIGAGWLYFKVYSVLNAKNWIAIGLRIHDVPYDEKLRLAFTALIFGIF